MSEVDESEVEDLVRRAVQATYAPGKFESDVDYVDASYEGFEQGRHLLRVRAPDHEVLEFERWLVVTLGGREIYLRGAGRSGPNEFYVLAKLESP